MGKVRSDPGNIDPLKMSCGTVNNSSQFVLLIAFVDSAEAINPNNPPMNEIRMTVTEYGKRIWEPSAILVAIAWMMVQTNP